MSPLYRFYNRGSRAEGGHGFLSKQIIRHVTKPAAQTPPASGPAVRAHAQDSTADAPQRGKLDGMRAGGAEKKIFRRETVGGRKGTEEHADGIYQTGTDRGSR